MGTYDAGQGMTSLFIDGVMSDAGPATGQGADIVDGFVLGVDGTTGRFVGSIDEVALYDYPLSGARVVAHFNAAQ